jgi:hypothetical protein
MSNPYVFGQVPKAPANDLGGGIGPAFGGFMQGLAGQRAAQQEEALRQAMLAEQQRQADMQASQAAAGLEAQQRMAEAELANRLRIAQMEAAWRDKQLQLQSRETDMQYRNEIPAHLQAVVGTVTMRLLANQRPLTVADVMAEFPQYSLQEAQQIKGLAEAQIARMNPMELMMARQMGQSTDERAGLLSGEAERKNVGDVREMTRALQAQQRQLTKKELERAKDLVEQKYAAMYPPTQQGEMQAWIGAIAEVVSQRKAPAPAKNDTRSLGRSLGTTSPSSNRVLTEKW